MKYQAEQKKLKPFEDTALVKGVPNVVQIEPNLSTLSEFSNVSNSVNSYKKVGRQIGSTAAKKESKSKRLIDTKNIIAKKYVQMKADAKKKNNKARVSKGSLQQLIQNEKKKRQIDGAISPLAIRKRVLKNSLESRHLAGDQDSPLLKIEPAIVSIIV